MKRLVMCDDHIYRISDSDAAVLRRRSQGLARLIESCEDGEVTHFVCESCGQICPLKLRTLHTCSQ